MRTTEDIHAEMMHVLGFIPPYLEAASEDPVQLEGLWQTILYSYLRNPLPSLLKERFLTLMSRRCQAPGVMIMRCCRLRARGVKGGDILKMMLARRPTQAQVLWQLESLTQGQSRPLPLPESGSELEMAVLWAAMRMTTGRDYQGGCRSWIRQHFGEKVSQELAILGGFAALERLWCDSYPEAKVDGEPHVRQMREQLVVESPELAELWQEHPQRQQRRRMRRRESKLVVELASQDRIRAAVEASERRFRAVVHGSPYPMMVYAEDGEIVSLNPAWTAVSGWDSSEIRTVWDWARKAELGAELDERELAAEIDALYESDEAIDEGEVTLRAHGGGQRVWTMTSAPIGKLPDGRRGVLRTGIDVTERRSLEMSLWDTNRKMSHILESISDGFISLNAAGRFLFVNSEAERMLQVSREELVGRHVRELAAVSKQPPFAQLAAKALAPMHQHGELTLPKRRTLTYRIYPSEEATSIFLEDITEQRRTEEALATTQEYLRQVAANIREVFWVLETPSLRVLYVTPSYRKMWGGRMSGRSTDWFNAVHEADRARVSSLMADVLAGQEVEAEFRVIHREHGLRWVRARCSPVRDDQGVFRRIVGIGHDVTEQREAAAAIRARERMLHEAADNVHCMVYMTSADGQQMLYISKGVEHVWGYTQQEAYEICASKGWQAAIHSADRQPLMEAVLQVAEGGKDATVPFRIIRKDGAVRDVRTKMSAVKTPEGDTAYVVGMTAAVTDSPLPEDDSSPAA